MAPVDGVALELRGGRPAEIQHALDEILDPVDAGQRVVDDPPGLFVRVELPGEELDIEIDAGQGVADLVGDAGRKLTQRGEPVHPPHPLLGSLGLREVAGNQDGTQYGPVPALELGGADAKDGPEPLFSPDDQFPAFRDPAVDGLPDDRGDGTLENLRGGPALHLLLFQSEEVLRHLVDGADRFVAVHDEDAVRRALHDIFREVALVDELLVEARVFDDDARLVGEDGQVLDVLLGEDQGVPAPVRLDETDDGLPQMQGNGDGGKTVLFCADLPVQVGHPAVGFVVPDIDGLAGLDHHGLDALVALQAERGAERRSPSPRA